MGRSKLQQTNIDRHTCMYVFVYVRICARFPSSMPRLQLCALLIVVGLLRFRMINDLHGKANCFRLPYLIYFLKDAKQISMQRSLNLLLIF